MKYDVYTYSRITEYVGVDAEHHETFEKIASNLSLNDAIKFAQDFDDDIDSSGLCSRTEYKSHEFVGIKKKMQYEYMIMYSYVPLPYGVYGVFVAMHGGTK